MKDYVNNRILKDQEAVSMRILHNSFDVACDDTRYRHKLKTRLQKEFHNQLTFVQPSSRCAEVVFSNTVLGETMVPQFDSNTNIKVVSTQLRDDILSYANSIPKQVWPPTVESLTAEYGNPPLTTLRTTGKHLNQETFCRLVDSYTADFIHGVTRGKVVTPKHYLFALGLHNLTGQ